MVFTTFCFLVVLRGRFFMRDDEVDVNMGKEISEALGNQQSC